MPKLAGSLSLLVGVIWATAAGADPPGRGRMTDDVWQRTAQLMEALEYDSAIETLGRLVDAPDTPAADRLRALELQGVAHVGAGRDDEAVSVFRRLRRMDPGHLADDPTYSPKIRALFERGAVPGVVRALQVLAEPPAPGSREVLVTIRFDPRTVAAGSVVFRSRWSDGAEDRELPAELVESGAMVRVPWVAGATGVQRLRVSAVVLAPSGTTVARAGSPEDPVILEIRSSPTRGGEQPEATSLTGRWWFWTGLGALVAGGVAVALVAAAGGSDARDGTLGSQQMR